MNATSYHWSYIGFYTFITYASHITYTYNYDTARWAEFRNSHRSVHKYFSNFTGKHLCWSLFFTKLQTFRPATSLKRDSYTGVFCEIWEILKSTYFEEHLWTTVSVYRLLHRILIYTIHYSTRFSFLQITSSLLHN